ncbi:amidohydrolase family protein [Pseudonocardia sp. TRM90224]|uniref:amidohydrolase family protein n=1 Tax=Pseudonocardia sp. TRM90224 TaxID=2812678 RepID=UPI001E50D692|nr:amidohydrolase family protein [Pseudonocardia sp. TRM90224]
MKLLIRHGCVINTEPHPTVHRNTDVLIEDGRIVAVGPDLDATGAEVLDATDRIVLPGFVDTHRHGWQSILRAVAMDVDIMGYMELVNGRFANQVGAADLAVAAELTGLECLDAGITTLQDYAHIMHSPAHADAVIGGLTAAGVRAAVAYGRPVFATDEPWRHDDARRVREQLLPSDDALVTMMLAAMGPSYHPMPAVKEDWALAEELGLRIAVHVGAGPESSTPIAALHAEGLARPGTVYVHGNSLPDDELTMIADTGGALSITPAIEARMDVGGPTLGRVRRLGVPAALGVDVVTSTPGDMFSVMRAALMSTDASGEGRVPAADILHAATMGGAAALGMADRIGSLRVGKQADIVLLRTDTVSTVGGHDPVGIVVNAHPGVVDTVLVAGEFAKRDGKLVHSGLKDVLDAGREAATRFSAP